MYCSDNQTIFLKLQSENKSGLDTNSFTLLTKVPMFSVPA